MNTIRNTTSGFFLHLKELIDFEVVYVQVAQTQILKSVVLPMENIIVKGVVLVVVTVNIKM